MSAESGDLFVMLEKCRAEIARSLVVFFMDMLHFLQDTFKATDSFEHMDETLYESEWSERSNE